MARRIKKIDEQRMPLDKEYLPDVSEWVLQPESAASGFSVAALGEGGLGPIGLGGEEEYFLSREPEGSAAERMERMRAKLGPLLERYIVSRRPRAERDRERYANDPAYRERLRAYNRRWFRERYRKDPEFREKQLARRRRARMAEAAAVAEAVAASSGVNA